MTRNPLDHPSPLVPAPAGGARAYAQPAVLPGQAALPGTVPVEPLARPGVRSRPAGVTGVGARAGEAGRVSLRPPLKPLAGPGLLRQRRERLLATLITCMVLSDALAVAVTYLLALPLYNRGGAGLGWSTAVWQGQVAGSGVVAALPAALAVALVWVLCLAAGRVYDPVLLGRRAALSTGLLRASFMAVVVEILLLFLFRPRLPLPGRLGLTAFWVVATGALLVLRWTAWRGLFVRFLRGRPMGAALIVGGGPGERVRAEKVLRWMLFPPVVVGYSDGDEVVEEIEALAQDGAIDQVIVTREDLGRDTLVELVQRCVARGLTVTAASHAFDVMIGRTPVAVLDGMPVLEIRPSGLFGPARRLKRAIDFTGALLGGFLLLPLFGLIALLVRLSSPGPVLYRQQRVGRGGRVFHFYKFRTMVVNNDEARHRAYLEQLVRSGSAASVDTEGNKIYKLVDDPRVTRIGAFLRRTSLDELPQLWNVLKGEMSLVGPRPCLHYEWDLHKEWQKRRLDVTPGLTGLWQVTGRSRVSFEEMVLLDLYYIARWSPGLDVELILRTIPVMLFGLGGH